MPRRANAEAGEALQQANHGLLERFSRARSFNSPISRELMLDAETRDIGRKIANCALTLRADVLIHQDFRPDVNLKAARVCNTRLCPFCEQRRTRVWRKRLYSGLEALYADKPKLRGVFLTLTVKNVLIEDLGDELDKMNRAWERLTKKSFFPTEFWFRRTEVTVSASPASGQVFAHPHFHVLLLVKPSYFSNGYVKKSEWQKQWMDAARLNYAPIVDVRTARKKSGDGLSFAEDAKSSVLEAAKYAAKATELLELGPAIREFHWQLRNRRLYSLSSKLRKYIKAGEIEASELMDNDSKPLPAGTERVEIIAQWFEDLNEYLITDLTP